MSRFLVQRVAIEAFTGENADRYPSAFAPKYENRPIFLKVDTQSQA